MEEANKDRRTPDGNNEFERRLRQKTERFELKPSPEVWQNVQAAIQKDRRRKFAWWLMAAMLFTVFGTGAYFMLERKSEHPSPSPLVESRRNEKPVSQSNSSSGKKEDEQKQGAKPGNTNQIDLPFQEKEKSANDVTAEKSSVQNQKDQPSEINQSKQKSLTTPAALLNETVLQTVSENNVATLLPDELIQPLSLRESGLLFKNDDLLSKKSFPGFSPVAASDYSICFEADAMPLASFVRSKVSSSQSSNASIVDPLLYKSSYSFVNGFSAGGNFTLEKNKKWLFGVGAHLSKTHLEALTSEQTIPQFDTTLTAIGDTTQMEITHSGDVLVQHSQHSVNQWFDVSLFAGIRLFPASKNHLRMLAGAGYSRLLSSKTSPEETSSSSLDVAFTGGAIPNTGVSTLFYQKNQLQFFSEIGYQRDLTSRLSFTTGMQFHYYPLNLLKGNEISQHMMWMGLKGGFLFRL